MTYTGEDDDEDEQPLSDLKARLKASDTTSAQRQIPSDAITHGTFSRINAELGQQRPLVDRASNRWLDEKTVTAHSLSDEDRELCFCDLEDDSSCPNVARQLLSSRRFRRMLAIVLVVCVLAVYIWKWYLRPRLQEEWELKEGFLLQQNGTYGIARGGEWKHGNTKIQTLDSNLLPGGSADPEGQRRLVFVGDIHGCSSKLESLLKKVDFNAQTDQLIATGDVISKGPDSPGVLDELIRLNAMSVRGNHEDRILTAAGSMLDFPFDTPSAAASSKGYAKDAALLKQLKPHHLRYLRDMPLILRIPALPLAISVNKKHKETPLSEEILVVHAGLVPAVSLERQDPYFVMNMRSLHRKTHVPSANRAGEKGAKHSRPWVEIWNWYHARLHKGLPLGAHDAEGGRSGDEADVRHGWIPNSWSDALARGRKRPMQARVVVYGHDSKAGLNIRRWSKGLDTGCVGGGELTALILDAQGKAEVFSVGCKGCT